MIKIYTLLKSWFHKEFPILTLIRERMGNVSQFLVHQVKAT